MLAGVGLAIVAAAVGFVLASALPRVPRYRSRKRWKNGLDHVMEAHFDAARLMNKGEFRVFRLAQDEAREHRGGHLVFAQVALGEILTTEHRSAFAAINSKRVDVLIVRSDGFPHLAIECQGLGHYQGDSALRDAIKREALGRAGVRWLEVSGGHSDDDVRRAIREALHSGPPPQRPVPPLPFPPPSPRPAIPR